MLGIKDPQVLLAYSLCILSTLYCIYYAAVNWNKGDEPVYPEDEKWVKSEKETDDEV